MARIPRPGTRNRRILDMLPATNAEIGDELEMHSGEVARTMAGLRHRGLVLNANPGKGQIARYVLAAADTAERSIHPREDA